MRAQPPSSYAKREPRIGIQMLLDFLCNLEDITGRAANCHSTKGSRGSWTTNVYWTSCQTPSMALTSKKSMLAIFYDRCKKIYWKYSREQKLAVLYHEPRLRSMRFQQYIQPWGNMSNCWVVQQEYAISYLVVWEAAAQEEKARLLRRDENSLLSQ